ncbi:MAG: LamG-like jellyroll fold domain-containing protein [Bacteroidota bacterium]
MKNIFKLVTALAIFAICSADAQTLIKNMSSTDGSVNAIVKNAGLYYIGGNFSYVGLKTMGAASLTTSNDYPDMDFPGVNGTVNCAVPDGSGGWYIGGSFGDVDGTARYSLAHIKSDKSLDPDWAPQVGYYYYYQAITSIIKSGNTIYIAGGFTSINGDPRNYAAAVDATNGALLPWNPDVNGIVNTICLKDTIIYMGGSFGIVGGKQKPYFAAVNNVTGFVYEGVQTTNGPVNDIVAKGDTLFIGGDFTEFNFKVDNLAHFTTTSDKPDTEFPVANSTVYVTIPDGSGGWFIGGDFTVIGNANRYYIAHILSDKSIDVSFDVGYIYGGAGGIRTILKDGNTLYIGGGFYDVGAPYIQRNYLAAVNATTGALLPWNPNADGLVYSLEKKDTSVYAGGSFQNIGGKRKPYFAQLGIVSGIAVDGTTSANGAVRKIVAKGDSVFTGGEFTRIGFYHLYLGKLSTANDNADVNFPITDNIIYTSVADGSGGWYVGGDFTVIGNATRYYVAHILSDNSVDPAFDAGYIYGGSGGVRSLLKDGSTLYIGGGFSNNGLPSLPRNYIAALNAVTGAVLPWNPNPDNQVLSIARKDTAIYIGGNFSNVGGKYKPFLAQVGIVSGVAVNGTITANSAVRKIVNKGDTLFFGGDFTLTGYKRQYLASYNSSASDAPDENFPEVDGAINVTIPDGSGGWYVGGSFTGIGGVARPGLARINSSGQVVVSFSPAITYLGGSPVINALTIIGTRLVIGGLFDVVNGSSKTYLAAVLATTGAAVSWTHSTDNQVYCLANDGTSVFAGGAFTVINAVTHSYIAKFNSTGTVQTWSQTTSGANAAVRSIVLLSSSRMIVAGDFTTMGVSSVKYIAKMHPALNTGNVITTWNPDPDGSVYSIVSSGNRIYMGGTFGNLYSSTTPLARSYIACVDTLNGAAARPFNPVVDSYITSLALDGSKLHFGGAFNSVNGVSRTFAAACDTSGTGSLNSFDVHANAFVRTIAVQSGKILMSGDFTEVKSYNRNYLGALLHSTGRLNSWDPYCSSVVRDIAVSSSSVYAVGAFDNVDASTVPVARSGAASWSLTTSALNTWNPQIFRNALTNPDLNTITLNGSHAYLGGDFDSLSGARRNHVARVNLTTGSVDVTWNPDADGIVYNLTLNGSNILAGGGFTFFRWADRSYLAAIRHSTGQWNEWYPLPDYHIYDLATTASGIFATGSFAYINDSLQPGIAKFNFSDGNLASWNPQLSYAGNLNYADLYSVAVNGSHVYFGGQFDSSGMVQRKFIADADESTGVLSSWNPSLTSTVFDIGVSGNDIVAGGNFYNSGVNIRTKLAAMKHSDRSLLSFAPQIDNSVSKIAYNSGNLYIAGGFDHINSDTLFGAASFSLSTLNLNSSWNAKLKQYGYGENANMTTIAASASSIYIGGPLDTSGTTPRSFLVRVDPVTAGVQSWNPSPNATVNCIVVNGSSVLVGGSFAFLKGAAKSNIAAIDSATGLVVNTFNGTADAGVNDLQIGNGVLYAGGYFNSIGAQSRHLLAALNLTTGIATSFNPSITGNQVSCLAHNGTNLYFGGLFSIVNGNARSNAASVNGAGVVQSWIPNPDNYVNDIFINGSTFYLAGQFNNMGAAPRNYLASVNASGAVTIWNPSPNSYCNNLTSDGTNLYIAGTFSFISGQSRGYAAAVSLSAGNALQNFDPQFNNITYDAAINGNTVFYGGAFTATNGSLRQSFTGLNKTTSIASNFNPQPNNYSLARVLSQNNTLSSAGSFTLINNHYRGGFAVYNLTPGNCPPIVTPVITPSGATTFCATTSVTLSAPAGYTYIWSNGAATQNIIVNTSGEYAVTITDNCNYSASSAVVPVTVLSTPVVSITPLNPGICPGDSVQLFTHATASGTAFNFNGTDAYVDFVDPVNNSLEIGAQATIETWVKFNSITPGSVQTILSKDEGGGSTDKWIFCYHYDYFISHHGLAFHINDAGGSNQWIYSDSWLPLPKTWYHIALVKNGNQYTFYVNGTGYGTTTNATVINDVNFNLTAGYSEGNFYLDGALDELRVWDTTRNALQIVSGMNTTYTSGTPGLAGYWKADEESGNAAIDSSGNANNGVLVNAGYIYGAPSAPGNSQGLTYSWSPATGLSATNISNPYSKPAATTAYTVTVTKSSSGCSASANRTVTVGFFPHIYYADVDGDDYGDVIASTNACTAPDGYVIDSSDCNDMDAAVNPASTEICNGFDDDCDGLTDENLNCFNVKFMLEGFNAGGGMMYNNLYLNFLNPHPDAADSITIELHDVDPPYGVIESQSVILFTNGNSYFTVSNPLEGNSYYVAVHSRNSLATWSKFPVMIGVNSFYDFITP